MSEAKGVGYGEGCDMEQYLFDGLGGVRATFTNDDEEKNIEAKWESKKTR